MFQRVFRYLVFVSHGIVYSHFKRWYKSRSKDSADITQVRIVDHDVQSVLLSDPSTSASTDPASG